MFALNNHKLKVLGANLSHKMVYDLEGAWLEIQCIDWGVFDDLIGIDSVPWGKILVTQSIYVWFIYGSNVKIMFQQIFIKF